MALEFPACLAMKGSGGSECRSRLKVLNLDGSSRCVGM